MKVVLKALYLMICFQLAVWPAHGQMVTGNVKRNAKTNYAEYDAGAVDSLETMALDRIKKEMQQSDTQREVYEYTQRLEKSEIANSYPSGFTDAFLTGHQSVEIVESKEVYSLASKEQVEHIPYMGPNYKTDTQFEIEKETGELLLKFVPGGELRAIHRFGRRNVVSVYEDADFVFSLEKNGTIYAVPKTMLALAGFKLSVAWIKVAKLPQAVMKDFDPETIRIRGATPGVRPFREVHENAIVPKMESGELAAYYSGDLVVEQGPRENKTVLGIYSRRVMREHISLGTQFLDAALDMLIQNSNLLSQELPKVSQAEREIIDKIKFDKEQGIVSRPYLNAVKSESYNNQFLAENPEQRGVLVYEELAKDYELLAENAKRSDVDINTKEGEEILEKEWDKYVFQKEKETETFFKKYKYHIATLAMLTTTYGLQVGLYEALMTESTAWYVEAYLYAFAFLGDAVRDADYLMTNTMSVMYLSSFVLILHLAGTWVGKRINMDSVSTILKYSLNYLWAYMMYPLFKFMAKASRQDKILEAIKAGVNPFKLVRPESEMGRKLGLDKATFAGINPFFERKSSPVKKERIKRQNQIIGAYRKIDLQRQQFAYIIAAVAAAKSVNVDVSMEAIDKMLKEGRLVLPEQLLIASEYESRMKEVMNGTLELPADKKAEIMRSFVFMKTWRKASVDMYFELLNGNSGMKNKIASDLTGYEVERHLGKAIDLIEKAYDRPNLTAAKRYYNMKKLYTLRQKVGNSEEGSAYQHFKDLVPDKNLAEEIWGSFKSDFLFSAVQMGILGERAYFDKPMYLGADPSGFGFTFRPHNADMAEQVFIHMMPAAADSLAAFSLVKTDRLQKPELNEQRYRPIEDVSLRGPESTLSVLKTAGAWLKHAGNLSKAQYPMIFLRVHKNKLFSWRANLTLGMGTLMVAGLPMGEAFATYIFLSVWGLFGFAYPWKIGNYANLQTKRALDAKNEHFMEVKSRISMGLRTGNSEAIRSAYQELEDIYHKNNLRLKTIDRGNLMSFTKLLAQNSDISNEEAKKVENLLERHYGLSARLSYALKTKDVEKIRQASEVLKDFLHQSRVSEHEGLPLQFRMSESDMVASAVKLLEYSLENPPFPKYTSGFFRGLVQLGCASLTTYWASTLFANALDKEMDSWKMAFEAFKNTAIIYAGLFSAQAIVDKVAGKLGVKVKEMKDRSFNARSCKIAFKKGA